MSLTPGTTLGPYEVLAAIGAGGMGEVYKARDTKLDRDVALKILPDAFVNDPERLARFQREAKVLASLNHPNIAAIHGLEESGDSPALVLEYVPGPTLQDRIAKGPIPLDEALPIARQIAEALEAAHEQGIIHRDLKPANVKVKDDGTVKVLDFGLAKALQPDLSDLDAANSPTMTMTAAATKMGVIMGTAAYMSPEQARAGTADRRSDIWAFGVVLLEMLTGQAPFTGKTVSDTLALVLTKEPDWATLPANTPGPIRRLLRRCLEKEPKQRLGYIGDARLDIDDARAAPTEMAEAASVARPAVWQRPVPAAAMILAAVVLGGLAVWSLTRPPAPPLNRFAIATSPSPSPGVFGGTSMVALSPDGRQIVYNSPGGQLYVRDLDQLDAVPLRGAENATGPFFSPDGQWVGFLSEGDQLVKVSIHGGPPVTLGPSGGILGASWGRDDTIIFSEFTPGGLFRIPAAGGDREPLTTLEEGEVNHTWPEILPGGEAVLFTVMKGAGTANWQIDVLRLATGERTLLVSGGSYPRYATTGHLVFAVDGTLRAVLFDLTSLTVTGDPVPVLEGVVTTGRGAASASFASDGTLVYVPGGAEGVGAERTLVWVDREGTEEPLVAEPRAYLYPRISPDGARVALAVPDEERDIWIWDFVRETLTRLTFASEDDRYPAWTPDGQRVAFSSTRDGTENLFWKAADGTGTVERLTESPTRQFPYAFTPDGSHLVFRQDNPDTTTDLVTLALDGERSSEPLLATEFSERNAVLSPDGRYFAYQSNASGQDEIYVQPFPDVDEGRWQISTDGGFDPLWGPDGRELFYRMPRRVMAVTVETSPSFTAGSPDVLFEGDYFTGFGRTYDISPDGQRFLMIKAGNQAEGTAVERQLVIVQNWFSELQARVPTGR